MRTHTALESLIARRIRRAMAVLTVITGLLASAPELWAQETSTTPGAGAPGTGVSSPGTSVCFDRGHYTLHGVDGAYSSFGELLGVRGYDVVNFVDPLRQETLARCDVLVIVDPLTERLQSHKASGMPWSAPFEPAFSRQDLLAIIAWIEGGGALFLVFDHAPLPGASRDLLELLGAITINGYTWEGEPGETLFPTTNHVFNRASGTLAPHPITDGASRADGVRSVVTFGGAPFYPSAEFEPLMVFPPGSVGMTAFGHTFEEAGSEDWPRFDIGGWLQAGARRLGSGRVVILGEAATCTRFTHRSSGLSADNEHQNSRFCHNTIRWLAGELEPDP